ncbi:acyl-CoA binding protein, putative [Trypanosoma equiperdum]|uniref:Acyl-CoA binding protein, putative n=2 Tax=Trypanozoon TaxID=39700 RepID=Q382P9_TRYB2|nr:acyl-CoA binding protein, putative [Trypanosoma brucei brucei TREU927]EAN80232.1 acyl-CoA binding protein, putative [Trypanosoma brucei brucei TREU927]SCU72979.1 acyl-CoA binding protein, putative [Trypanosoma equiperdum]
MWSKAEHLGEPVTFLLEVTDGVPADPAEFLDDLLQRLREVSLKGCIYEAACRVYNPLLVYVSLMDDPDTEPVDLENQDEVGIDEWFPLHLAIVLLRQEVVEAIVTFHRTYGGVVLDSVSCGSAIGTPCEYHDVEEQSGRISSLPVAPSCGSDALGVTMAGGVEKSQGQLNLGDRDARCQIRREFAGAFVVFGANSERSPLRDGGNNDSCNTSNGENVGALGLSSECKGVKWPFRLSCVSEALRPLLLRLVWEGTRHRGDRHCGCRRGRARGGSKGSDNAELVSLPEGCFTERIARLSNAARRNDTQPLSSILVDSTVMYDVCNGNIATLFDVLEVFDGLLLPVFCGETPLSVGDNGRLTTAGTGEQPDDTRGGGCGCVEASEKRMRQCQLPLQPHFYLSCPVQDPQKLAFILLWVDFRRSTLLKLEQHGPDIVGGYSPALRHGDVPATVPTAASLHSVHLFLLLQLVSLECTVQKFLPLVEAIDETQTVGDMPVTFVAALVAGAVAASFPQNGPLLLMMCEKLRVLLASASGEQAALRRYVASPPASEAERFSVLWLMATPSTPLKKFSSRAEMLYFGLVESVLLGAEKLWATQQVSVDARARDEAERALADWLVMCCDIFDGLKDCEDGTPLGFSRDMVYRLMGGCSPCPTLHSILHRQRHEVFTTTDVGEKSTSDFNTTGNRAAVQNPETAFAAAQQAFARIVGMVSNDMKLNIYALYKQATVGDINISRPWLTDVVGRAKWDAWCRVKGMSKEVAEQQYVSLVSALQEHRKSSIG